MGNASAPLFAGELKTIDQMVKEVEDTLRKKATTFDLSLGIFKSKAGTIEYHAYVSIVDMKRSYHVKKTFEASSFTDMMQSMVEVVDQLNRL